MYLHRQARPLVRSEGLLLYFGEFMHFERCLNYDFLIYEDILLDLFLHPVVYYSR